MVRRAPTGVLPGEPISMLFMTSGSVEIVARGGRIIEIKGAEPKMHGLAKLSSVDLENAIVRSGKIRRTPSRPRLRECSGEVFLGESRADLQGWLSSRARDGDGRRPHSSHGLVLRVQGPRSFFSLTLAFISS